MTLISRLSRLPLGKLVLVFAVMTLLPLAVLGFLSVRFGSQAVEQEVNARLSTTASVSSQFVKEEMEGLGELVESYANRPNLIDALERHRPDRKTIRMHLGQLREREGVATTFLADPRGKLIDILPRTPSIVGDDFSYRDWHRGASATDGPYISEAYESKAKGRPTVVAAAARIVGRSGRNIGIVVAAYGLGEIQDFVDGFAAAQGVRLTVTDQRGVVVAAPGANPDRLESVKDVPGVAASLEGRSGLAERDAGGDQILSAYGPVPELGWTVTAEVPAREAFAGVSRLRTAVLSPAIVLVLVLLLGVGLLMLTLRERHRVEKELEDEQQRSRLATEETLQVTSRMAALVESSDDAIIGKTLDGTITSWNAGAERLYGYSGDEVIGRRIDVLVPPDHADDVQKILERIAAGRKVRHFETVRVAKDGRRLDVSVSVSPVLGGDGRVVGASTIARDISETKRAQRELERKQTFAELLQAVAEAAGTPSAADGALEMILHRICTQTGWAAGRVLLVKGNDDAVVGGPAWHDPEATNAELREHLHAAPDVDKGLSGLVLARRGSIWVSETDEAHLARAIGLPRGAGVRTAFAFPVGVEGEVRAIFEVFSFVARPRDDLMVAMMDNVTIQIGRVLERKLAEEKIVASEERFRVLVETSKEWIWAIDAAGKTTYSSPAAEAILGYSQDELQGKDALMFLHDDDRALVEEKLPELAAQKKGWSGWILRWRTKDGGYRSLESAASPIIGPDRELEGFRGVDRDVTEKRELEEQLRQSQKMDAIGQLAGGVAHDFNNLLSVILNYAAFIEQDLPADSAVLDDVLEIKRAGQKAADLVRQLLQFSRKQIIDPVVVDPNEVVSESQKMLRRVIPESIRLDVVPGENVPRTKVDPGQLEQVLLNLVVNARDAMPGGGSLVIETAGVHIDPRYAATQSDLRPGHFACITVSDTGTGIPPAMQARIFEPFFTTKEAGSGTGLGLSTVFGIVKQAGGFLTVYSEEEMGTTFKVYLPVTDEAASEEDAQPDNGSLTSQGETILVAEDEDAVRRLVVRILEGAGYNVVATCGGQPALEALETGDVAVDLLVTDVVMPEMSGKTLSERSGLETLYMSGYTHAIIAEQGVLDAGDHLLQKPFTDEELLTSVREMLGARAAATT